MGSQITWLTQPYAIVEVCGVQYVADADGLIDSVDPNDYLALLGAGCVPVVKPMYLAWLAQSGAV